MTLEGRIIAREDRVKLLETTVALQGGVLLDLRRARKKAAKAKGK